MAVLTVDKGRSVCFACGVVVPTEQALQINMSRTQISERDRPIGFITVDQTVESRPSTHPGRLRRSGRSGIEGSLWVHPSKVRRVL